MSWYKLARFYCLFLLFFVLHLRYCEEAFCPLFFHSFLFISIFLWRSILAVLHLPCPLIRVSMIFSHFQWVFLVFVEFLCIFSPAHLRDFFGTCCVPPSLSSPLCCIPPYAVVALLLWAPCRVSPFAVFFLSQLISSFLIFSTKVSCM